MAVKAESLLVLLYFLFRAAKRKTVKSILFVKLKSRQSFSRVRSFFLSTRKRACSAWTISKPENWLYLDENNFSTARPVVYLIILASFQSLRHLVENDENREPIQLTQDLIYSIRPTQIHVLFLRSSNNKKATLFRYTVYKLISMLYTG